MSSDANIQGLLELELADEERVADSEAKGLLQRHEVVRAEIEATAEMHMLALRHRLHNELHALASGCGQVNVAQLTAQLGALAMGAQVTEGFVSGAQAAVPAGDVRESATHSAPPINEKERTIPDSHSQHKQRKPSAAAERRTPYFEDESEARRTLLKHRQTSVPSEPEVEGETEVRQQRGAVKGIDMDSTSKRAEVEVPLKNAAPRKLKTARAVCLRTKASSSGDVPPDISGGGAQSRSPLTCVRAPTNSSTALLPRPPWVEAPVPSQEVAKAWLLQREREGWRDPFAIDDDRSVPWVSVMAKPDAIRWSPRTTSWINPTIGPAAWDATQQQLPPTPPSCQLQVQARYLTHSTASASAAANSEQTKAARRRAAKTAREKVAKNARLRANTTPAAQSVGAVEDVARAEAMLGNAPVTVVAATTADLADPADDPTSADAVDASDTCTAPVEDASADAASKDPTNVMAGQSKRADRVAATYDGGGG
jgi:hypothetical protein